MPARTPAATRPPALPRLAAMFLTDGHRIPPEVLETLTPAPAGRLSLVVEDPAPPRTDDQG